MAGSGRRVVPRAKPLEIEECGCSEVEGLQRPIWDFTGRRIRGAIACGVQALALAIGARRLLE